MLLLIAVLCVAAFALVAFNRDDRRHRSPPLPRLLTEEELALADARSYVCQLEDELERKQARAAQEIANRLRCIAIDEEMIADLKHKLVQCDRAMEWMDEKIRTERFKSNRTLYRLIKIRGPDMWPEEEGIANRAAAYIRSLERRIQEA